MRRKAKPTPGPYLIHLELLRERVPTFQRFPFCLSAVRHLVCVFLWCLHPEQTSWGVSMDNPAGSPDWPLEVYHDYLRLLRESGPDLKSRIERAYRLALARPPRTEEMKQVLTFREEQSEFRRDRLRARLRVNVPEGMPEGTDPALAAALADFGLALFNRNEFTYVR